DHETTNTFDNSIGNPFENDNKRRQSTNLFEIIDGNTSPIVAYAIYNNSSAVLKITSFRASNVSDVMKFRQVVSLAHSDSASKGIKNLIIDLIDNGGGLVCLSLGLSR